MASISDMKGNVMEHSEKTGCTDNARNQLRRFGYNMVALALSIGLYYLGFFGTVEGPLNPSAIGQHLKTMGFSGKHLLYILFILFAVSLTWNWIYNGAVKLYFNFKCSRVEQCEKMIQTPESVQKGKWGHTVWAAMLILFLTFAFHMFKN